MSVPADFCPYVGLQPYTEADRDYFFGRQREQRIISANLYAAPLTVLYGASGVGKSSVLLAGVVPHLRAAPHTAVVVFRDWQGVAFLEACKLRCLEAVTAARQEPLAPDAIDPTLPFDDFLYAVGQTLGGSMLLLFDQFEEYFLYHPESETGKTFDSEFARAINRNEVDASFLIALREDALSQLDRFRARIPNLLSNILRLQHMDSTAAEEAIRKPLEVYNTRFFVSASPVSVEDELVQAILTQVRTGHVQLSQATGVGSAQTRDQTVQIEAPFLQLVMTRRWDEEISANSRLLRLAVSTASHEVDYEIFHDVLAPAILNWRAQYIQAQERAEAESRAAEQQRHAEEQARAAGRLRRLVWALVVLSLLAIGVAGFAVIENHEAERARQDAAQQAEYARKASQDAKRQAEFAERARQVAEDALAAATAPNECVSEQRATAVAVLLDKAQTDFAAAERSKKAAPSVAAASTPARIYIQIQNEQQRTKAQRIEQALEAQKLVVPGIARFKTGPTAGAEVRFFRDEDRDDAHRIVAILQDLQVQGAQAKYVPGYEGSTKIRPKHYEIWFASGSLQ